MSIPKILVIEDNIGDLVLIRYAFDELGEPYHLEVLPDGELALAFVDDHRNGRLKNDPCVILLDLHLPKYNGIEVLSAIRLEPALTHIHVFVLTSDASPSEMKQISELGGVCCFKPSDLDGIKALAEHIMATCKGTARPLAAPTAN